jgi:Asparagine synthase
VSYPGELSDASFARLHGIAGAMQHAWDRIRCIGTQPSPGRTNKRRHDPDLPRMRRLRLGSQVLLPGFRAAHHEDLLEPELPSGPRDVFTHAMTTPRKAARINFMAQFGVEWRDPMGDRRLLERLLRLPLSAFRVGNRPRGLARELGRGLLPDNVRLRRTRAAQASDQAAWFPLRAADYGRAFQSIRESATCAQFMDTASLGSLLGALCAGHGSARQAAIAHQALDVGLFTVAFESGLARREPAALDTASARMLNAAAHG